ncbi:MAG: hypothetical protein Q7R54_02525, partial [bacterium]|nr:hypothetical protein [bacterium]
SNLTAWNWLFDGELEYRRNILRGALSGHSVEIFDLVQRDGFGKYSTSKKRTIVKVDGVEKERGSMTGFITISMLKSRLEAIKNSNLNL